MKPQTPDHSTDIKNLIRQNSHLFWFVPGEKKEHLSKEVVLETIFNYGDMTAVKKLIKIIGFKEAKQIFHNLMQLSDRRKGNFHELTANFFNEYFERNSSGNIQ